MCATGDELRELDVRTVKTILGYPPKQGDIALTGRLLIVPVKIDDNFSTLELIDEAGNKSALAGGAKRGGYWASQPLPDGGDGEGLTLAIGEGVATVLSACLASEHPGVATLSAGNLPRSIQIIDRHCSRGFAVVEVECSTKPRMAINWAVICSHDRGRMDQSVFKTLVVAFSVIVLHVFEPRRGVTMPAR